MGFLLECPNCGWRDICEFSFGGETRKRPRASAPPREWARYAQMKENVAGIQQEWWYHELGCGKWFQAVRDTRDNTVVRTFWPGEELA